MRFWLVIMPRGWRQKNKYQGKMAKAAWKDRKRARRQLRTASVNAQLSGATDHSMPWWREPTVASLIGRRHAVVGPEYGQSQLADGTWTWDSRVPAGESRPYRGA